MKKTFIAAIALASLTTAANAQVVESPSFFDNVTIGLDGGVTTPMSHNAFFGSMRGAAGLHIGKQITPVFGAGVEGLFAVNTSSWKGHAHSSTAFDNSYVGVYGTADLFNLFGGYPCGIRPFTIEALVGAGWGHDYYAKSDGLDDWNYFATKVGLNFNFNVSEHVTFALKPSIIWNMNGDFKQSVTGYNINQASFNLLASVNYRFGDGFPCVRPYDAAQVDALNSQINELRGSLDASVANANQWQAKADALATQLDSCRNQAPKVVKEVNNEYNSVRFVFFRIGSYKITADQMPNITMIADYMKNHPDSKVVIKGYASQDGNLDFNIRLAKNRAEAVKEALIKKYKISADRIQAEGQGIGHMFEEESWNRVSICTLESANK